MDSSTAYELRPRRVLVVAEWAADPQGVVSACLTRREQPALEFALVVPARLHGLDWVGDPQASLPCAKRQLASISVLADADGLKFATAAVGDPNVVAAIGDALADWPADELLVCARALPPVLSNPFDLPHRVERATGLPVQLVGLPKTRSAGWRRASIRRRNGHCAADVPQPA